ncbi:DUF4190 domain-containing protein [Streptomyces sp. A1136]|uniref:DUF4190 domain-containing protein n=1 Tax=Streptomyces sp. A1136 TaxID=2563102 RepID=UPI00109E722D|nr:DUF4190 domain-containing protein [Streptomyces sp. A1136]THA51155.1 hypothetical protein E6R62_23775 [Streptomyces sp. A1136]
MSTPPNPPSSPSDPPTEPSGTPVPDDVIPARAISEDAAPEDAVPPAPRHPGPGDTAPPAEPLSPAKAPSPAAEPLSLTKKPRPAPWDTDPRTDPRDAAPEDAAPPPATPAHSHFAPLAPPPVPPQAPPPGGAPYAGYPGGPGPTHPGQAPQSNPFAYTGTTGQPGRPESAGYAGYPGQPGHPGYPGYPGYPAAPARPSNHLAIAALVLGLAAICFGVIPFAFWIGTIVGLVGLGLGIAAIVKASRGAPRKAMSVIAAILCVLGLFASVGGYFLTVAVLHKASDHVDRRLDHDWNLPDDPVDPDETTAPDPDSGQGFDIPVPFGSTVSYSNGVRVSLSEPKKYVTKSKYIEVGNAVGIDITITNSSDKPIEVIYAVPTVRDEHGDRGKLVFDGLTPKMVTGTIQPGASATGFAAYEVPEGTTRISADVSPVIPGPPARFLGSIG